METVDPSLINRLRAAFDQEAAVDLLRRAIACPSVTGDEAPFAALLAAELRALGADGVTLRDFEPGRPNVWATRAGGAAGGRLLLIGHTDTVHVRGWREHWAGTEREDPFGAALVDGAIWGRGASDLKAGLCATLAAVRTLDRAGVPLRPTVTFAFVGDEESGEPGSGVSAGIRAFIDLYRTGELERPDFALYVEPTMLDIYAAHMGFFLCDIAVTGKSAYFGVPELGVDALKATNRILAALWEHSDGLANRPAHPLVGPEFVLVTSIRGGGLIAVPGECTISLIHKIAPGRDLEEARKAVEETVRGAVTDPGISVAFTYTTTRDHPIGGTPFATEAGVPTVQRLIAAIQAVRPDRGRVEAAPYWSELPFLSSFGVPGVYFAPGDIKVCHTPHENVVLQDYCDGVIALAAFLADYGRA